MCAVLHTPLCIVQVSRGYSATTTHGWLQNPIFPHFFLGTFCLCEKCHWGLPIPAWQEERKQRKESHEWWWWWLSVCFSDLVCPYSSHFLLIPVGLVLLLPVEHSRLQMIPSRHRNRKLSSILGLFSVYSCINEITSPS